MNPFLFYLLAERLAADPGSGPAEFRSAISRAYYAAYHTARDFLTELGIDSPKGPAGHGKIPIALMTATDPGVFNAGSDLDDMKGKRNKADYALADPLYNQRSVAQDIVKAAFQIVGTLNGCLHSTARRPQVEAEIKDWIQNKGGKALGFSII